MEEKILLKKYHSEISKELSIYWKNNKRILNTKNANYSYDGLQEVLEKGLNRIPIKDVNSVLVIGLGGGCVIESLRKKYAYDGPIDGVELDPVVIDIAEKVFDIHQYDNINVFLADGKQFLAEHEKNYDLIIVDVFVDLKVPEKFYSERFLKKLEHTVNQNGFVLFNVGVDLTNEEIDEFMAKIPESFIYIIKYFVLGCNTVAILQKAL